MASYGCQTKDIQTVQPFPSRSPLAENLSLPLSALKSKIGKERAGASFYVLRSVEIDHEAVAFEQHGSAPNFQGGVLTLCTCEHRMRATQAGAHWPGVRIAESRSTEAFVGEAVTASG